jgi:Co/Zn/Cd efflux system component
MMSALTHVGGDTMRTASVFIAAVIATASNASSSLCDAWAAVVVSFTICCAVIPLINEIYKAARR